jgi:hypothetical protein
VTKTDFLNLLEQRLIILNEEERIDLLSEYEQHIEMKMQSGLSEEEAIADFGDPEEMIRELLEAYHLNTDYQPKNQFASKIIYAVKSCTNFLSSTFDSLCQRMRMKTAQSKKQRLVEQDGQPHREPFKVPFPDISVSALCMKVIILCCRFVGFFFLLFAACSALGLIAGAATALVFVVMGYSIIGPFLVVLGCALIAIIVTALLIQFVFGIGGAKA